MNREENMIRLPADEYGWNLYDAEGDKDGIRAVYGNGSGEWVSIRPDVKPPQHEIQIFAEDGSVTDRTQADIESLAHLIERNFNTRIRDEVRKGGAAEAYDFAWLQ